MGSCCLRKCPSLRLGCGLPATRHKHRFNLPYRRAHEDRIARQPEVCGGRWCVTHPACAKGVAPWSPTTTGLSPRCERARWGIGSGLVPSRHHPEPWESARVRPCDDRAARRRAGPYDMSRRTNPSAMYAPAMYARVHRVLIRISAMRVIMAYLCYLFLCWWPIEW